MTRAVLYRSILEKLRSIPLEYLQQVDNYLATLQSKTKVGKDKAERVKYIMAFAGAWSDMMQPLTPSCVRQK